MVAGVADGLVELMERLLRAPFPVGVLAWDGSRAGPAGRPCVVLRSRKALRHLLWRPDELGLARAYVSGELDVEGDLAEGLRLFRRPDQPERPRLTPAHWAEILRVAVRARVIGTRPRPPAAEARLTGRLHTRRRDQAAIAHHYDLSNEFYQLLLDPNLAYSCAYWTSEDPSYSLHDAQKDKLELVCAKLGLRPGTRLLDLGCGWGSLVLHAAKHHGVRATGVTLSRQQYEFVRERVAAMDLRDQVEVRLGDYRELAGPPFDAVASIEVGEHVGDDNYPAYAATMYRLLEPGGRLLLQQMSREGTASGGGAFIENYIAPDMTMRPVGRTLDHLGHAGFEIRDVEAIREHYVRTCRAWLSTLEARWPAVVSLIGLEQARTWRLYLTGAALAFEENRMGVDQIVATRTTVAGHSGMPATRREQPCQLR